MRADLASVPIPNVLEEAPDDIFIAVHKLLVVPQVTWIEFQLLLEVSKHFEEVCLNV